MIEKYDVTVLYTQLLLLPPPRRAAVFAVKSDLTKRHV